MSDAGLDRFYLARHGVTIVNLLRERGPGENEPLLPAGREQARKLAGQVGSLGIERIWTSPLHRARESAEIVAEACGLPLEVAPGLREIGAYDDRRDAEASEANGVDSEGEDGEGEAFDDAVDRVRETLERIVDRGEVFLGVTHVGPMRIAKVLLCNGSWDDFWDFTPENCQLAAFRRNGGAWEVHVE